MNSLLRAPGRMVFDRIGRMARTGCPCATETTSTQNGQSGFQSIDKHRF
ncbi:hypothetical protein [Acetobacter sp.]|nr:hypothetical protein [Acetobacter sp.]MCI1300728.1 hypothetical protein [Acetobacter sp.]